MEKFWTWFKRSLIIIGSVFVSIFGIIASIAFIKNQTKEQKQINKNDELLNNMTEKDKKNEEDSNNINNDFNNSPYNKSRNKRH